MGTARLALADGSIFTGEHHGAEGTCVGEAVFNTGLSGYQEVLTDPSYSGQIVCMTASEIGNYGICQADMESSKAHLRGFIMRHCCVEPSNFRSEQSLGDFLRDQGIVGIDGIDTRALTKKLRSVGAMNACLSSDERLSDVDLIEKAKNCVSMEGQDLASGVSCSESYEWDEASNTETFGPLIDWDALEDKPLCVAIDFGIKYNILRLLKSCGFDVRVVPARTSASEILALKPAAIFVSNGPGDPAAVQGADTLVAELIDSNIPMFGICLGHQIISLSQGAKTFKLKFGHRGANHPIKNFTSGEVEIASHNHGFAVDAESLPEHVEMTHINLNDNTCAGIRLKTKPVFSVQYHPEAGPGPSDPLYLFKEFTEAVRQHIT